MYMKRKGILGKGNKCRGPDRSHSRKTGEAGLKRKMECGDEVRETYVMSKIL